MIQALSNQLNMMTLREKRLIIIGALICSILLFWAFIWEPLQKNTHQLEKQLINYQQEYQYIHQLQQKIYQARQQSKPKKQRIQQSPSQFIENLLHRYHLKQSLQSMRGTTTISINLNNIKMNDFSLFLNNIEEHPRLSILKLEIHPLKQNGKINAKLKLGKPQ